LKQTKSKKEEGISWETCEICGKPVVFSSYDVCTSCRPQREKEYQKVGEYLRTHLGSDIATVSAATGVPGRLVLKMMRRGSVKVPSPKLKCASCGKPIEEGKFCVDCAKKASAKGPRSKY
jgi:hypothetical protein